MRIAQVVSAMNNLSSGVQSYLDDLCAALSSIGEKPILYTCGSVKYVPRNYELRSFPTCAFPAARLGRSPGLKRALFKELPSFDIVQTNALWMLPNLYPAQALRCAKTKLVTMPHGSFSSWSLSRSKWRKKVFGWLGQNKALARTDMFIATCEAEYEDIRRLGFRQPVAIIPIGVDVKKVSAVAHSAKRYRRLVFMSRIHPVKNIEMLLRVWSRIAAGFPDWQLSLVGPDKGAYADQMKLLAQRLGCPRTNFEGALLGEEKYKFLWESSCFVLPTFTENFGIVIAESLACALPVVCTRGAPWGGIIENDCGWWPEIDETQFQDSLVAALSSSEQELRRMGENGRRWVERDFSWGSVACKLRDAYRWLIQGGTRPGYIL